MTVSSRISPRPRQAGTVTRSPQAQNPALAQLAAAAVSGLAPAGPELRELAFAGRPGVVIDAPLSVREAGFSLHAEKIQLVLRLIPQVSHGLA